MKSFTQALSYVPPSFAQVRNPYLPESFEMQQRSPEESDYPCPNDEHSVFGVRRLWDQVGSQTLKLLFTHSLLVNVTFLRLCIMNKTKLGSVLFELLLLHSSLFQGLLCFVKMFLFES